MGVNKLSFEGINLFDNENIKKIRLKLYTWDEILGDENILYKAICDLLLSEENLFYYATQKESTKTLESTKLYVKRLIEKNIIDTKLEDIYTSIGWKGREINIDNTRFQGDLAEYLMSILIDKITNIDTLISKVSLKTSPRMSSYGNDNIYFDYEKDILYYGESKFYDNTKDAISQAISSINKHANIEEICYIRSHDNVFIAEDGSKRERIIEELEEKEIEDVTIKNIFFVANDDIYLKEDYERVLLEKLKTMDEINAKSVDIIMVFLPVLSKNKFLNYFKERLNVN